MRTTLGIFIALSLGLVGAGTADEGVIRGRTLTESGKPEPGVKIRVNRMDDRGQAKAIRYVETDPDGAFVMDKLAWGTYRVLTWKETARYPNMAFSFYSNDTSPIVKIDRDRPVAEITINLGPKAGLISGTVIDAATGQPVNPGVHLWRILNPNRWIETAVNGSGFELLVPPDVPVGLTFQADGYREWTYPGPNATAANGPLVIHSGDKLSLDVRLERAAR